MKKEYEIYLQAEEVTSRWASRRDCETIFGPHVPFEHLAISSTFPPRIDQSDVLATVQRIDWNTVPRPAVSHWKAVGCFPSDLWSGEYVEALIRQRDLFSPRSS